MKPDEKILSAFNLNGDIIPLPGGQNNSWKTGGFVLKYVAADDPDEWTLETLASLRPEGFRISQPVRAATGDFIYDGWMCSTFEPGDFFKGREAEKLAASRSFHRALAEVDVTNYRPPNNRWQKAHEFTWQNGGTTLEIDLPGSLDYYKKQLVHADLSGNILFSDKLDPLIIDFSPTMAPVEYAEAILVADSIAWYDAPLTTLGLLPENELTREMLLRAVIFRLAVAAQESATKFEETKREFGVLINRLVK